jgi:hypothetical protein
VKAKEWVNRPRNRTSPNGNSVPVRQSEGPSPQHPQSAIRKSPDRATPVANREIRFEASGYDTMGFDARSTSRQKVTYREDLRREQRA